MKYRFLRGAVALALAASLAAAPTLAQSPASAQSPVSAQDKSASAKPKSNLKPLDTKNDPTLIGKRDINKGNLSFYSLDREVALGRQLAAEQSRWLRRWNEEMPTWDRPWRAAANSSDYWFELTPAELRSLSDEVMAVFDRYADRRTPRDGTERVITLFHAFPERRAVPRDD